MIKVNHYQKAAPEYIHEKKQETAKKMGGVKKLKAMMAEPSSKEWFAKHGLPKK